MTAIMGAGAVVGGLVSASRRTMSAKALPLAAIGWGTAITLTALAPSLWMAYVVLVFVGYGSITFNSLAKTTLQLAAAPEMRGRVMALWGMAWLGSTPIGGPLIGWIGEFASPRWCLLAGGGPTILAGVLAWLVLGRRASGQRPDPAELDVTEEDLVGEV
jgi:MFS family permease